MALTPRTQPLCLQEARAVLYKHFSGEPHSGPGVDPSPPQKQNAAVSERETPAGCPAARPLLSPGKAPGRPGRSWRQGGTLRPQAALLSPLLEKRNRICRRGRVTRVGSTPCGP